MSQAPWNRVREVFFAAVERDPSERDAFLEKACAGEEALRCEVESLLSSDEERVSLFAGPVFEVAAEMLSAAPEKLAVGRRIGPYEVLRELGRGGMGAVYLAVRADDQFQHRVAIKLLQRGMDSAALLRRFEQERQILASLDHPYIARLLDGGVTADGLPYFIMEYVEGIPIDEYCRTRRLSTRARLELFRRICAAVHHAHRNLVVHRDLKPSNILVNAEGQPKLLDFGVAKLLSSEYVPRRITATAGPTPMTPEYASPEQVRGEPITTASDVYSLGVLLYELLTGSPPYRFENRLPSNIERVVSQEQPEKPSKAVRAHPAQRGPEETPKKLLRRLAGDLDNIVLMALRKDAARRYGSVEQLSEDLRRYLKGQPVIASGDTLGYLCGKFVRRHRWGVAVAALVALSLVAGILTISYQARQARAQQARADRVSEFLVELFRLADPYKITGGAVSARQLLDEGEKEIRQKFRRQPELLAALMGTMGQAYVNLGLYAEARPLLEEALEIRRQIRDAQSPEVAVSLDRLGYLLRLLGESAAAEPLLRESLGIRRRRFGEVSPEVATSLGSLGSLLRLKGDYSAAETHYRRALDLWRKLQGEEHMVVARSLNNLALLLRDLGRYDEAESLYRRALTISHRVVGERHADVAIYLHNLGELLTITGEYAVAEEILRRSLALNHELLDENHPALARGFTALGLLLQEQGDFEAAQARFRQALELHRRLLGEKNREVANMVNLLGALLRDRGDLAAARPLLEEALKMRRELLGADHVAVAYSLVEIARLHLAEDEPSRAAERLREALRIRREKLPRNHRLIARTEGFLGECLTRLRRFDEAEPLLVRSYRTSHDLFGAQHPRTLEARRRIDAFAAASSRPDLGERPRPVEP